MFRDNEAGRVGEVLARAQARDVAGTIAAALQFWQVPQERPGTDAAAIEVWTALAAARADADACAAALPLIRDGRLLRPHAFIDIVEYLGSADPLTLLAVAEQVLAHRWPVEPYLAAIFFALVDAHQETALWTFIQAHRDALAADTPTWTLVAVILTTSRIGDRYDLAAWFKNAEARANVPAWVLDAGFASDLQVGALMSSLFARGLAAWSTAVRDATSSFALALVLMAHLHEGRDAEFLALFDAERAALVPAGVHTGHPLVAYVNASKHARRVDGADLAYTHEAMNARPTMVGLAALAASSPTRPPHWRIGLLIQETPAWVPAATRLLPLHAELCRLERGDPRIVALVLERQKARPSALPALVPSWDRMVRAKTSWLTRMKLAFV